MVSLLLGYQKKTLKLVRIPLYYTTCCNDQEVSCFSNNAISVFVPIANKRYDDLPRLWFTCLQQNQKRVHTSLHNDTRVVCVFSLTHTPHSSGHQAEDQMIIRVRVMLNVVDMCALAWSLSFSSFPFPTCHHLSFPFPFFVCRFFLSLCCINPPLSFICHAYSRSNNNYNNSNDKRRFPRSSANFIQQCQ